MSGALAHAVVWLNAIANACGRLLLAPIAVLPGSLSATIVAAVTGVLLLYAFKFTSNQRAIKQARNGIKANLLALKLFKDSTPVILRSQGRILAGAGRLFVLSLVPMLVMAVPVTLLMAQLAQWYQVRPLRVGEQAVLTVKLNGDASAAWPDVRLDPTDAVQVMIGPVRVQSQRAIYWNMKALRPGSSQLMLRADDQQEGKELAIGDGFMRVSPQRPGWQWSDALLNPSEAPFRPDAPFQSIAIDYPDRDSWTSGTDKWIIYWFAASMAAALCFRPLLHVNI